MKQELQAAGIRVELDLRNEKLGYKIREAQLEKVPYMLVLGEQEQSSATVSVRNRAAGDAGAMSIVDFAQQIVNEIAARK
ncbi:Threonine--tRNA ligase [compost metagenome]